MKKIFALLTVITMLSFQAFGQEKVQNIEKLEALESDTIKGALDTITQDTEIDIEDQGSDVDTTTVKIGKDLLKIEETDDATKIQFRNKELVISEDGDDTDIDFGKINDEDEWEDVGGARNFKGHLGGMEFGFNSFGKDYFSTTLPAGYDFLNLNSTKSSSFNFIFPGLNIGFSKHFGIVTAIGLNWNNYRFDGNNSITTDDNGNIIEISYANDLNKSKLTTLYAMVPVIFEGQIPVSHGKTLNIGAGMVGSIKLGSHTKVVYFSDGRQKDKNHNDFSLNLLRYGATARVGYEMFQVYGTCYFSPLFEKAKGPEIYPFEVGIALSFND
jgi:hypothetical protein